MTKKVALITGGSGQDGSYLSELLLKKNYKVVVADRRSSRSDNWRHKFLGISNKIIYEHFDITDIESIRRIFEKYKFCEVYNLAAQSFVGSSFNTPISTADNTGLGCLRILEVIRNLKYKLKFYQASTSEMIGNSKSKIFDENAYFEPQSPYAVSKLFSHFITKNYRESYKIFACSGILFNHESPLRGEDFVTKKITKTLTEIKFGFKKILNLGNIYTKRDWGYAKDYMMAAWLMLQQKKADDYVIATNTSYSVKDFINESCKYLNLKIKWIGKDLNEKAINLYNNKVIIRINKNFFRPSEVYNLKGNYKKARKHFNWKPETTFKKLIKIMINYEIKNISKIKPEQE